MDFVKSLISKANKKHLSTKISALIITIGILTLIIFAGPAKAFILGLTIDDNSPTKGEIFTFTATLDIQSMDKYLPIKNLTLVIDGPTTSFCVFDINGNPLEGCDDMTIIPINTPSNNEKGYGYGYGYDSAYGYGYDFGYGSGYGYGYGQGGKGLYFKYEITLDTTNYNTGNYESWLEAVIDGEIFESKDKPTFTINPISTPTNGGTGGGGGCTYNPNYDWGCSDWSTCVDGIQTRVCKATNNCGDIYGKPAETQACTVRTSTIPPTETTLTTTETTPGFLAAITGAVIGALGTGGTIVAGIVILGLIGTAVTLSIRRFKKK